MKITNLVCLRWLGIGLWYSERVGLLSKQMGVPPTPTISIEPKCENLASKVGVGYETRLTTFTEHVFYVCGY